MLKLHDKTCLIYGLFDPITGLIRYVGKSCRGFSRAWDHMKPFSLKKDGNTHKTRWIKKLAEQGLRPKPVILEVCDSKQETAEREIQWIKDLRLIGLPLTNITDGGDGTPGRIHSEATRRKIATKAMGRTSWNKGRKIAHLYPKRTMNFSDEHKDNLSKSQRTRFEKPQERNRLLRQLEVERCKKKKAIKDDLGNEYPSVREAAKILNIQAPNITCVLKGRYKQAGGRTFSYIDHVI